MLSLLKPREETFEEAVQAAFRGKQMRSFYVASPDHKTAAMRFFFEYAAEHKVPLYLSAKSFNDPIFDDTIPDFNVAAAQGLKLEVMLTGNENELQTPFANTVQGHGFKIVTNNKSTIKQLVFAGPHYMTLVDQLEYRNALGQTVPVLWLNNSSLTKSFEESYKEALVAVQKPV